MSGNLQNFEISLDTPFKKSSLYQECPNGPIPQLYSTDIIKKLNLIKQIPTLLFTSPPMNLSELVEVANNLVTDLKQQQPRVGYIPIYGYQVCKLILELKTDAIIGHSSVHLLVFLYLCISFLISIQYSGCTIIVQLLFSSFCF